MNNERQEDENINGAEHRLYSDKEIKKHLVGRLVSSKYDGSVVSGSEIPTL